MALLVPLFGCAPVACRHPPDSPAVFEAIAARDAARLGAVLQRDPSLAGAHAPDGRSAIIAALFLLNEDRETFVQPETNAWLHALIARRPHGDIFDAAATGDIDGLKTLIDHDPSLVRAFHQPFGMTALHVAAFAGQVGAIEVLISRGADPNAVSRNRFHNTPLITAGLTGQLEATRALLKRGAQVGAREEGGITALHLAAATGSQPLIELLLAHGADVDVHADDGATPLALARKRGRSEAAALLERRGGG